MITAAATAETGRLTLLATLWLAARFVAGFLLVAVTAMAWMVIALALLPWRALRIRLCNYYGKLVGYSIVRLALVTPVVRNRRRLDGSFPAIYVANHTSTLDAFLSIWLCPVGGCGVVKRQIMNIPFFGWLYRLSGHLMIDRERPGRAIEALNDTAELVKRYRLGIWIMPEGTRSLDGRLQPLKTGFVHLAIATGLPVVPVVFHGAHRAWPKKSLRVTRLTLPVDVLPALDTRGWSADTSKEHADQVYRLFAEALGEDQKPLAAS